MSNNSLQAAMAIWMAHRDKGRRFFPGRDEYNAMLVLADAFLMEHHPDLRDRMACNRCDLQATCEFSLEPYNLDCEPKIDMTAIEAMIHCLESVSDTPEDGEICSQNCYDTNGDAMCIR